eukprot:TRINITY_DN24814_c0_g1_i1.p1 TRINITY_DN24814_c0_g1~~TRINITY_DN24814_c0_g1_i1.p1  ORF type:complete len:543 (+),score=141.00 TRINITY_DN24814_c0_g1_i1:58-1686(+)
MLSDHEDVDDLAILCPADFEDRIDELNVRIKQKDEENLHLTVELRHVKSEKEGTDKKYQLLYDKYLAQQERKHEPSPVTAQDVSKMSQDLETKDEHIRELKKELLLAKATISGIEQQSIEQAAIRTELELKLQEQASEIFKSERLRELNTELHDQRDFYKEMMSKAESKLEEQTQYHQNTVSQLDRCKEKLIQLDDLKTDNIILSSKIDDLTNKLATAKEDVAPLKNELTASQRLVREHAATIRTLTSECDMLRESNGIGDTLMEDVQSFLPSNKSAEINTSTLNKLEAQVSDLEDQLLDSTREQSSLRNQLKAQKAEITNTIQLHDEEVSSLQQKITELTVTNTTSIEKAARLDAELQLKESEHATLTTELEVLKNEITSITSQSTFSSNELVAQLDQANARSSELTAENSELHNKLSEVIETKETVEKELAAQEKRIQQLVNDLETVSDQLRVSEQSEQTQRETAKSLRFKLEVESERASRLVKGAEDFKNRLQQAHRESFKKTSKLLNCLPTSSNIQPSMRTTISPAFSYTTPLQMYRR